MAWPKGVPRKPRIEPLDIDAAPPEEPGVEPLTGLEDKKLRAEAGMDSRGHELGEWQEGPGIARNACTRCQAKVAVREKDKDGVVQCDPLAATSCP